jgi:type III pantothenate kinase
VKTPLLLDCGNSSCKFQFAERSGRLNDQAEVLDCVQRLRPSEVVIASVSQLGSQLAQLLTAQGVSVLELSVQDGCHGLQLAYAQPQRLGVDRWLAMLAVLDRGRPVVVIDAGTALTIDLISADRQHQGGYILPGLSLMRRALVDDTFALPPVTEPGRLSAGHDTIDCIANGSVLALVGAVDNAVAQFPVAPQDVIWTGGDAPALRTLSSWPGDHNPQLIFEGMMTLITDSEYRASLL